MRLDVPLWFHIAPALSPNRRLVWGSRHLQLHCSVLDTGRCGVSAQDSSVDPARPLASQASHVTGIKDTNPTSNFARPARFVCRTSGLRRPVVPDRESTLLSLPLALLLLGLLVYVYVCRVCMCVGGGVFEGDVRWVTSFAMCDG